MNVDLTTTDDQLTVMCAEALAELEDDYDAARERLSLDRRDR